MGQQEDLLKYLSETRSYGVPMPDKLEYKIQNEGSVIGEATFSSIRWFNRKAQLSLYIIPSERNRGIGTKTLKSLIETGFNELDLHRLEAEVYEYNKPSLKLVKHFGFSEEGRFREAKFYNGKYYDILFYGLLKEEYKS